MARAALRLSIIDLARDAKVAPATLIRLEGNLPVRRSTIDALHHALERRGIAFTRHRDGDGIRLTHAGQCVHDLLALAKGAAGKAKIDTAIRQRIDRYLAASLSWQKDWRLKDGVYSKQLKELLNATVLRAEPGANDALEQALDYIEGMTRSPPSSR